MITCWGKSQNYDWGYVRILFVLVCMLVCLVVCLSVSRYSVVPGQDKYSFHEGGSGNLMDLVPGVYKYWGSSCRKEHNFFMTLVVIVEITEIRIKVRIKIRDDEGLG